MCNQQIFSKGKCMKHLSKDIINLTPQCDGYYCVDFVYCMYCCAEFNGEPYIFGERSLRNGFAFIKPMEMHRQLWNSVSCCVPNHLTLNTRHTSNETTATSCTSRESKVMQNIWNIYIKVMKKRRSDIEYSEEVANHERIGIDVGNRPHSEEGARILERIVSHYVCSLIVVCFIFFFLYIACTCVCGQFNKQS